jgi:gluconate 2-dehydrogenase gamma chain
MTDSNGDRPIISRRDLLRTAGAAGAAALIPDAVGAVTEETSATASPTAAPKRPADSPAPSDTRPLLAGPLTNLTASETEILSAMVDRLIPTDELGPGALDAGVLEYIDRALSEAESDSAEAYRSGLAALDTYSRYTRGGAFIDLSTIDQDSVLIDVQIGAATGAGVGFVGSSGSFFNIVKNHTWQGMFGDPKYGGNADFAGWDLINYPGVRLRMSPEDQKLLEADQLDAVRRSAYDFSIFE